VQQQCGVLLLVRNVHPTSRVLQAFNGGGGLPAGMMIISSRSLLLCSWQAQQQAAASSSSSAAIAAAMDGGAHVVKQQLAQWSLSGLPLSCAAVTDGTYVIGCDSAGERGRTEGPAESHVEQRHDFQLGICC